MAAARLRTALAAQTARARVHPVHAFKAIEESVRETQVHEAVRPFHLDLPADLLGTVLATLHAVRRHPALRGASYLLDGKVPAGRAHALEQRLPALTRATLDTEFDHYRPVRGPAPSRPRWDHDPPHRKQIPARRRPPGRRLFGALNRSGATGPAPHPA